MISLLEKMKASSAQGKVREEIRQRGVAAKFTEELIAKMCEEAGKGYSHIFWMSESEDGFNESVVKALAVKKYFEAEGFTCEVKDNLIHVRMTISWEVPDDEA